MANLNTKTIGDGVGDILAVEDGVTGSGKNVKDGGGTVTPLWLTTTKLGIGITPTAGVLELGSASGNSPSMYITNTSGEVSDEGGNIIFRTADGETGSVTNLTTNDVLGDIQFQGRDASDGAYITGATIRARTDGAPGTNSMPTELAFYTNSGADADSQKMCILANGNVGIGTDAPADKLFVQYDDATAQNTLDENDSGAGITIYNENASGCSSLHLKCSDADGWISYNRTGANTGNFLFETDENALMSILSNGNVGIGATAPDFPLHIYTASGSIDARLQSLVLGDAHNAVFTSRGKKSGGSERYAQLGVVYNASGTGASDEACGFIRMDQTDGAITYMWAQNDDDIQVSPTHNNIGTTNGTAVGSQTSDERMKNISGDAFPYGLDEVNKLTPIKYVFKSRPDVSKIGFGAQTTQAIIPECVYNSKDCPDGYTRNLYEASDSEVVSGDKQVGEEKGPATPNSSETDKLYMQYVEIIPVLVKAIQELSAKVTALENA